MDFSVNDVNKILGTIKNWDSLTNQFQIFNSFRYNILFDKT